MHQPFGSTSSSVKRISRPSHGQRVVTICMLAVVVLCLATSSRSLAQTTAASSIEEGIAAFRADRYEEAEKHFLAAAEADEQNAEAHFLLARLYFETPLKDRRRAQRELTKAMEIEPDNVQYMTARLLQLREESWNFIVDRLREARRRELSQKILALDPKNAYANEEMGISYIRDFWRYRNAVQLPDFEIARRYVVGGNEEGVGPEASLTEETDGLAPQTSLTESLPQAFEFQEPGQVFLADEFDIDRLEQHGVNVRDLSQRAKRVYDRAVGHLSVALEVNPRHRSVYDQLMKVYALRGDYDAAMTMLEQMYVYFPEDPGLWFYLGMANHRSGNPEAAAKSFDRGLELASDTVRQAYNDVRFLLKASERKAYDADPVTYRNEFWTSKDPRYLTTFNERRIEHYARVAYADLLYGVPVMNIRGWETERGQILIRYGVPNSDVVIIPDRNIDDIGADRLSQTDDPLEIRAESANSNMSFEVLNTYNIWSYDGFRFVFEDPFRTGEYRLYSPSAEALSQRALPWHNDYEISAKERFNETPDSYVYEAPGRKIELPYLVNAFKGSDPARAELYVHYGIPLNDVDSSTDIIEVTAKEGTFLIGEDRSILSEERRTIYGLDASHVRKFQEAALWINSHKMTAPAGKHELSVELEIGSGSTVAIQRRSIDVPSFEGDKLQMSDVLLAYGIEESRDGKRLSGSEIVRHGYSIAPAPWSVFGKTQPIYLYFEFYNLDVSPTGETSYEMEAVLSTKDVSTGVSRVVKGIFGGREKGVSVRIPGTGRSADEGQYLIMDVSNEDPGLYTLRVKVTDTHSGKSVERTKDLYLE